MNQHLVRAALAVGVAGLAASSLAAAPANAATVVQVRAADLVTSLNDVRSAGHYDFLAQGVHVKTDDTSSNAKVALYFPVTAPSRSHGWTISGTAPNQPRALSSVFDADGNVDGDTATTIRQRRRLNQDAQDTRPAPAGD